MLLLLWSGCGLQPLAHLVECGCIDLTTRIPLAEYLQGGRLNWRHALLVVVIRRMTVSVAEPAYNAHDEERQDNDPQETAKEQQR